MQNVKTEAINYYGYLQGFKVFIDGQKYPKNKGEWYTTLNEKQFPHKLGWVLEA